jgi:hypothetical protein
MKLKLSYTLLTIAIAFLVPMLAIAQGGPGPIPPDPNDVPIDGGLSLLLAAGAGYVAKKGYDAKKKKVEQKKEILP